MPLEPPPAPRRFVLSRAARAMRLQRIFARMQEGASYVDIAAEEGVSRQRLRQIVSHATRRRGEGDEPSHKRMQIARLTPALRLAAAGVAKGEAKSIPLLLQLVDRLDRYCDPDEYFDSPAVEEFVGSRGRKSRRRERAGASPRGLAEAFAAELNVAVEGQNEEDAPETPCADGQALENTQNGVG